MIHIDDVFVQKRNRKLDSIVLFRRLNVGVASPLSYSRRVLYNYILVYFTFCLPWPQLCATCFEDKYTNIICLLVVQTVCTVNFRSSTFYNNDAL